jgi:hypothetical protein
MATKKKGGMAAYEKSSYDKKADAAGKHGKEGSPKDMKADKAAAKKLGYMKFGGAMSAKKVTLPPSPRSTAAGTGAAGKSVVVKKAGAISKTKKK